MIYAVIFEDDENHASKRSEYMADHLAFLAKNSEKISAAGPLTDVQSDTAAGGLWLVEAQSPQVVKTLIEIDPFWPTGLRKSVRILEWKLVFREGASLI